MNFTRHGVNFVVKTSFVVNYSPQVAANSRFIFQNEIPSSDANSWRESLKFVGSFSHFCVATFSFFASRHCHLTLRIMKRAAAQNVTMWCCENHRDALRESEY
jgi:hypothetical protein